MGVVLVSEVAGACIRTGSAGNGCERHGRQTLVNVGFVRVTWASGKYRLTSTTTHKMKVAAPKVWCFFSCYTAYTEEDAGSATATCTLHIVQQSLRYVSAFTLQVCYGRRIHLYSTESHMRPRGCTSEDTCNSLVTRHKLLDLVCDVLSLVRVP